MIAELLKNSAGFWGGISLIFRFFHKFAVMLFSALCLYAGILVEGIGTLLDGIMGTGNGTTSTSINVGVVGLTKVCPVVTRPCHCCMLP